MLDKIAKIISIVFEPFTVSFLALILVIAQLEVSFEAKVFWFVTAVVLGGLPPLIVLIYEKKIGKIHDWFMTNRLERRDVQFAWFFGSGLFSLVAIWFSAPRLLTALSITLFVLSLVITVATLYWKISVHMVGVSLFVMLLLLVFSASFLWAVVLIPLVAWARVRLKAHTLSQVTVGSIVTITVTLIVFNLFGLATF
jgi:membrane-associated phospholipid phosphatase